MMQCGRLTASAAVLAGGGGHSHTGRYNLPAADWAVSYNTRRWRYGLSTLAGAWRSRPAAPPQMRGLLASPAVMRAGDCRNDLGMSPVGNVWIGNLPSTRRWAINTPPWRHQMAWTSTPLADLME